jgi:CO/xanthine dehydrogenase Mo-binding subunit
LQNVFGSYLAQVAEVEVAKDGSVRVHRVVCAMDCGTAVNPPTVQAQIQSGVMFGMTAALYGEITLKNGPWVVTADALAPFRVAALMRPARFFTALLYGRSAAIYVQPALRHDYDLTPD